MKLKWQDKSYYLLAIYRGHYITIRQSVDQSWVSPYYIAEINSKEWSEEGRLDQPGTTMESCKAYCEGWCRGFDSGAAMMARH